MVFYGFIFDNLTIVTGFVCFYLKLVNHDGDCEQCDQVGRF